MNPLSEDHVLCSFYKDSLEQLRIARNGEMRFAMPFYFVPEELINRMNDALGDYLAAQAELYEIIRERDFARGR